MQIFTGQPCSCKRGQQRDNCPNCEGTGKVINFKAIREAVKKSMAEKKTDRNPTDKGE